MTKKKRYKRYSPEFKREALMRASEEGVTDVIVCEELDISARQLRRWRDEFRLLGHLNVRFWEKRTFTLPARMSC
jgi:transposase